MRPLVLCFLLVFAGFTLTSTTYLLWLHHLARFVEPDAIDALTLIGGYGLQALGLGTMAAVGSRHPEAFARVPFVSIVAVHFLCAVPAMMGTSLAGVLALGYLMNFLCGAIAAHYLRQLARDVETHRRGLVFGAAYACSTVTSWLLSLVPGMQDAVSPIGLIASLAFSALAIAAMFASSSEDGLQTFPEPEDEPAPAAQSGPAAEDAGLRSVFLFACLAVLLMSLVKNLGGGFPAASGTTGMSLELSRLFYAVGLVAAGIIIDRSRKYGAVCCIVALIIPFAFMVLANEPIPTAIIWCMHYLFTGFFSVFRVVLFADIASDSQRLHLACIGLLMGRIGDALGTAVYLSLGNNVVGLLGASIALFAATVFVTHRLGQLVFVPGPEPAPAPEKSERMLREEFAARHELSSREIEVLELLLDGHSNAEIASTLFVSESTAKFHVHNLLKKTGCKTRVELRAAFAASAHDEQ